jgi:nucleolar protein 9
MQASNARNTSTMPKELKKRGRREEKKRKHAEFQEDHEGTVEKTAKKQKPDGDDGVVLDLAQPYHAPPQDDSAPYDEPHAGAPQEVQFYGLLDDEEQAYFKRADTMLELNQFGDSAERTLFLANVYKEAEGKELKLANSQSCSRLMERLIQLSSKQQLKMLMGKFKGHFLGLVQHRFASHCCEALFVKAAPWVTEELICTQGEREKQKEEGEEDFVSMESLFLGVVEELQDNLGYLMTDSFASHAFRVLLIVLSGRPLSDSATNSLLKSKKKEKVEITNVDSKQKEVLTQRAVPDSFTGALDKMVSGTISGLETNYIRALATQALANPVLQLLLELEFARFGKQKAKDTNSLFRRLIPDDPPAEGTESATFIRGLLYDPVGSRLLETIMQHAPGKAFKAIYKAIFRENLKVMIKNEIAGFVVIKTLERLSRENLQHALDQIAPEIPGMIERGRTSIIKTLIEQCQLREVNTKQIADQFKDAYGASGQVMLERMLKYATEEANGIAEERKAQIEAQDNTKLHGSLLAQAMLQAPGPLRAMIMDSLLAVNKETLVAIAKDRTATHVLQASLAYSSETKVYRRKTVQNLLGYVAPLALDSIGSHVVDSLWNATKDVFFLRERIAEELANSESEVRDSYPGRAVWRNWMMDNYKRRRVDWIAKAKAEDESAEQQNAPSPAKKGANPATSGKSALQLAREKFAAGAAGKAKAGPSGKPNPAATGVNAGELKERKTARVA